MEYEVFRSSLATCRTGAVHIDRGLLSFMIAALQAIDDLTCTDAATGWPIQLADYKNFLADSARRWWVIPRTRRFRVENDPVRSLPRVKLHDEELVCAWMTNPRNLRTLAGNAQTTAVASRRRGYPRDGPVTHQAEGERVHCPITVLAGCLCMYG